MWLLLMLYVTKLYSLDTCHKFLQTRAINSTRITIIMFTTIISMDIPGSLWSGHQSAQTWCFQNKSILQQFTLSQTTGYLLFCDLLLWFTWSKLIFMAPTFIPKDSTVLFPLLVWKWDIHNEIKMHVFVISCMSDHVMELHSPCM